MRCDLLALGLSAPTLISHTCHDKVLGLQNPRPISHLKDEQTAYRVSLALVLTRTCTPSRYLFAMVMQNGCRRASDKVRADWM